MVDRSFLDWPFFETDHKAYAERLDAWAINALTEIDHTNVDQTCRKLVQQLGAEGWLNACVAEDDGKRLDVRTLCLTRETFARHDSLADFAFAMQGLGSGPISLFGTPEQRAHWLPGIRQGRDIAAFALSEPEAGSDVSALVTTAAHDGDAYVLNGTKTWISNGGIADCYTVFARTGEAPGAKGLSAFVVPADTPGFSIAGRIDLIAPHPLGTLRFEDCRIPAANRLGEPGRGFAIAMATLDVFRATVGAAALGFARRALAEALAHTSRRELFGAPLAAMQLIQSRLADMAVDVDASALLVYRAAWAKDCHADRVTREASMAKLYATEAAQRVIDAAVQMHGGLGVTAGVPVERLYRDIRALRIYEGASEIQQQIIARQTLAAFEGDTGVGA